MSLVSLGAAKLQTKVNDPSFDAELTQIVEHASAEILDYLDEFGDPLWDESTTPPLVQSMTLLLVGLKWKHRGDDLTGSDDFARAVWSTIADQFRRLRTPTSCLMGFGDYVHRVVVQSLARVSDGEGGYIETWSDLTPDWLVSITPAGARAAEYETASTIAASATHVVEGHYRPDVDVTARLQFHDYTRAVDRVFQVTHVRNLDEQGATPRLLVEEQI